MPSTSPRHIHSRMNHTPPPFPSSLSTCPPKVPVTSHSATYHFHQCIPPVLSFPTHNIHQFSPLTSTYYLRGQCHDIFLLWFSIKQFFLVHLDMPRKDFRFFSNIREVIRIRNRLPSGFITGESVTDTNNSTDTKKIEIVFWTCLLRPSEANKSRDTVPLNRSYPLSHLHSFTSFSYSFPATNAI